MFKKIYFRITRLIFTLLAIYLTYLLLRYPAQALEYASTGLVLWFNRMIPTLLPFMILSGIMVRMNQTERFAGFFHPLFKKLWGTTLNGSYAIFMGMLCGFPMGARVIGELCRAGKLSEEEGSYLLAFCNNIGPVYFLSFVTSALSLSGWLPFAIMYGVPLVYGFILRRLKYGKKQFTLPQDAGIRSKETAPSLLYAIDEAIVSGLSGIGTLGGYMVFFNLLNILFLPFAALPEKLLALFNCALEITSGISRIQPAERLTALILLPFGGLSCVAQTYSMLKGTRLSINKYFMHKCIQTIITAVIYLVISASGVFAF